MKKVIYIVLIAGGATLLMGACKSRESEKRIAELESRLAQLENNKGAGATATPTTTTPTETAAAPDVKPEGPLPVAEFSKVDHDFGTITEGQKVVYTYKVKNTGQAPLIIQSAQPSCGCTVPKWSQEPIPVGGTGEITAEFDSNGKPGVQNKTITVTSNTWPKTTTLRFKAMVTPKAEANGPVK
ncbi:MAG: DUF1573 domain-containing protein [Cyclobacteriaceae bacterium]|nr:DUF1573 domain-containing protein [Cyclobacteriaceae bacterium]